MAKRGADTYLTHDNYNDEDDEPEEEEGSFQLASNEALNTRDIKKAKRRIGQNTGSPVKGAFQAFTGLTANKSTTGPTFAFGSMSNAPFTSLSSSNATIPSKSSADVDFTRVSSTSTVSGQSLASKPPTIAGFSFGNKDQRFVPMAKKDETVPSYLSDLSKLNESVLQWINQHVRSEPACILSPIFADYNRYIEELEKKYPLENNSTGTTGSLESVAASGNGIASSSSLPLGGLKSTGSFQTSATPAISGNLFGVNAVQSSGTGFFGSLSTGGASSATTATPALTPGAPAAAAEMSSAQTGEDDDGEYVPQKPVVVEVKEDDAFYSVRCKLFYKKDTSWVERGVGNLFLKPIDGGKTQMLIRADTNLGNILLNIMLSKGIRVTRMNTNNVSIFCVPNPPIDPKDDKTPVTMLVRVKNAEVADELIEKLNSHIN